MHFKFMMYFYFYLHHVLASHPAIFRVIINKQNCSYMCHNHFVILKPKNFGQIVLFYHHPEDDQITGRITLVKTR
jgi:hypothetical protein